MQTCLYVYEAFWVFECKCVCVWVCAGVIPLFSSANALTVCFFFQFDYPLSLLLFPQSFSLLTSFIPLFSVFLSAFLPLRFYSRTTYKPREVIVLGVCVCVCVKEIWCEIMSLWELCVLLYLCLFVTVYVALLLFYVRFEINKHR